MKYVLILLLSGILPAFGQATTEIPETACDISALTRSYVRDSMNTTGLIIIQDGKVVMQFGDMKELSYIASVRKSILSMLYGKYVENGTVDLNETIESLGLEDVHGLSKEEKQATIDHLLNARSGIYHPASNGGDDADKPERGSRAPGSYFLYNNWDFNVAGYILELKTGKSVYELFKSDIADRIGLYDYKLDEQHKYGDSTQSVYPAYHFYFSTRDMAKIGELMLNNGNYNGEQVISEAWIRKTTTPVSVDAHELGPYSLSYSYLWWLIDAPDVPDLKGAYTGIGAYGQYITIIPEKKMVIAHKTKAIYERSTPHDSYGRFIQKIVSSDKVRNNSFYTGIYQNRDRNLQVEIAENGSSELTVTVTENDNEISQSSLKACGMDLGSFYFVPLRTTFSVNYIRNDDGQATSVYIAGYEFERTEP